MIWVLIFVLGVSFFALGDVRPGLALDVVILFCWLLWRMAGALV